MASVAVAAREVVARGTAAGAKAAAEPKRARVATAVTFIFGVDIYLIIRSKPTTIR